MASVSPPERHTTSVSDSHSQAAVLFTAFEPSGDAHAAPIIRALLQHQPTLRVYAMGGPKMQAAGAKIIRRTADDGAMGLNAIAKARVVRQHIKAAEQWSREHAVEVHVPVDSPAANFPICKFMKRRGVKVIHLVAPQVWAWGPWRIRKLRRLTDMLLCLLPFEEQWFQDRAVPARFIGHPTINRPLDPAKLGQEHETFPPGSPRIALFPGSRTGEVIANFDLLIEVYAALANDRPDCTGIIVAANDDLAAIIHKQLSRTGVELHVVTAVSDAAVQWCDLALTVSGTMSLDIARQHKPMVGVYKTGIISWLGAKIMLQIPHRLLPNIIAGREICPEFVPHVGSSQPIVQAADHLLRDTSAYQAQQAALQEIIELYDGKTPADEAAMLILQAITQGK
jgi:lipid-A-disaccharide synthase